MKLPFAAILGDVVVRVFQDHGSFAGPDGVQHAIGALRGWTEADFERICAPWKYCPVIIEGPHPTPDEPCDEAAELRDGCVVLRRTAIVPAPEIAAAALEAAKNAAAERVDSEAEIIRQRYLTPGAGQAMAYLRKAEQARNVLAGRGDDVSLLVGLIGVEIDPATGDPVASLARLAEIVAATANEWEAAEAAIDATRRAKKIAIAQANRIAQVTAALAVAWPRGATTGEDSQ